MGGQRQSSTSSRAAAHTAAITMTLTGFLHHIIDAVNIDYPQYVQQLIAACNSVWSLSLLPAVKGKVKWMKQRPGLINLKQSNLSNMDIIDRLFNFKVSHW